jgi:PAS domain-containing protein
VLCVPVDGVALLRAVDRDPDAFSDRDRDLAELLGAHLGESLTRIRVGRTLRQREQDLLAERERLVGLFESVPIPLASYVVQDGRPVLRDANPSFESTFGVDVDAAVGDPLHDHVRPPEDGEIAENSGIDDLEDLALAMRSRDELEVRVHRETPGGSREFLLHAGSLEGREDEGYVTYTDVSERDRDRLEEVAEVLDGELLDKLALIEDALDRADADVHEAKSAQMGLRRLVRQLREVVADPEEIEREGEDGERDVEIHR